MGLGVPGYSDPLGLGVPDCLLLGVLGVLGVAVSSFQVPSQVLKFRGGLRGLKFPIVSNNGYHGFSLFFHGFFKELDFKELDFKELDFKELDFKKLGT